MHEEQAKLAAHEMPKLLSKDIAQKASELDREVKYLLNKLKIFKPKKAKESTKSTSSADNGNETKKETDEDASSKFDIPPPEDETEKKETKKKTASASETAEEVPELGSDDVSVEG